MTGRIRQLWNKRTADHRPSASRLLGMRRHAGPPRHASLALVTGVVCIGLSAIFVKLAAVPGPASAFYSVFFAAVVLVPWYLWKRPTSPSWRDVQTTIASGILFALDIGLWNTSLFLTSAANATLLANNAPLWVGLSALLIFHERLSSFFWLGMITSLIGTTLIVGSDALGHVSLGYGNGLALGASVCYAAYLLTTQRARANLDTQTCTTFVMVASAVVLLMLCLMLGTPLGGYRWQAWAALVGLGFVSRLGGWFAINYALGHIRSTIASVSLLGQAVVTALIAIPVLDEPLGVEQAIGGIFVLTGVYLVNRCA